MPEQTDVEALEELYEDVREQSDKYDDELGEFVDKHPTFVDAFHIYDEGSSGQIIQSQKLREPLSCTEAPDLTGEFEFAAGFGYKEALADVLCLLEDKQVEVRDNA